MAELQRLSSKQQILLNSYQDSDEQKKENEWTQSLQGDTDINSERVAVKFA